MEIKSHLPGTTSCEYRVPIALGTIEIDWLVPAFFPPTLEKCKTFLVIFGIGLSHAMKKKKKMNEMMSEIGLHPDKEDLSADLPLFFGGVV